MGNSYYKYRRSGFETNIRSGRTDTDSTIGDVILDPLLRYPVYTLRNPRLKITVRFFHRFTLLFWMGNADGINCQYRYYRECHGHTDDYLVIRWG